MTPDESPETDEDEQDGDGAEKPKPFERPKGLLKVRPEDAAGEFDVKSGAATKPPLPPGPRAHVAPPPPGAQVKTDRPVGPKPSIPTPESLGPIQVKFPTGDKGPKPRVPTPEDLGTPEIRFQTGEGGPKPKLPSPDELGTPEVQFQKGAPRLPKIEPIKDFSVVTPHAVPEPRPQEVRLPSPLEGEVEVVDYRKTGTLDVTGQVPDPFANLKKIGVVDTTFARFNMGDAAEDELRRLQKQFGGNLDIVRRTVPGVKDLAVECKILLEKYGCELVVACGMVGRQPVDKTCGHEASLALQWTQLGTNKHILEVFVHEEEAQDEKQLAWLMERRTREHAENAWFLTFDPDRLRADAGKGLRQGFQDAGPIRAK